MALIRRSAQAERDLERILADLESKNPAAAERYAVAFAERAIALAGFPEIGRNRPEIAPELRSVTIPPFVLFYRYRNNAIDIIRILHGMRDLPRMLQASSENE